MKEKKINYIESAYEIRTVRRESCSILINYLNNFPLFSSKYLDFLNWCKIHGIKTKKQYKELKYSELLFFLFFFWKTLWIIKELNLIGII